MPTPDDAFDHADVVSRGDDGGPAPGLDALRGLLALIVFVVHSVIILVPDLPVEDALRGCATAAVLGFFALSGYVIARSLDSNRQHGFSLQAFTIARIARIVPPLVTTILVVEFLTLFLRATGYASAPRLPERQVFDNDMGAQLVSIATLTLRGDFLGGGLNGPLWTLAREIQLYTVAGLAAAVLFARIPAVRWLSAAALVAYCLQPVASPLSLTRLDNSTIAFAAFAQGALVYAARDSRAILIIHAVAAAVVVAAAAAMRPSGVLEGDLRLVLHEGAGAGLFASLLTIVVKTRALARWHGLQRNSYTLYVLHYPLLLVPAFVASNLDPTMLQSPSRALWWWLPSTAAAYAVCMGVGRFVERPASHRRAIDAALRSVRSAAAVRAPQGGAREPPL